MLARGKEIIQDRIQLLTVVFFIVGVIAVARLFYLQIVKNKYYETVAAEQYNINMEILQRRGEIFMEELDGKTLSPLAINRKLNLLFAVPSEIRNPQNTAEAIAQVIIGDNDEERKKFEEKIYIAISKINDPYEPLWHRLEDNKKQMIEKLNLPGIYFQDEWDRYYVLGSAAAHITGFLGRSENSPTGQYGVEGFFEKELAGEKGQLSGVKDVHGRLIEGESENITSAEDGLDIVLTIDRVIQSQAFEIIRQAVEDSRALDGTIVVMDPGNGDVLALANFPSFDPNNYSSVESIDVFRNLAVSQPYEPGSIFKLITMSAGLDSGAVKVDDTYVDEGFVNIGDYTIRNANNVKYGEINMAEVLENSVNTGAIYVALKTGRDKFFEYVKNFGFGDFKGLGFWGAAMGDISSLKKKGDIYLATASYGQGITITALQMASAMSTIVNDGKFVYPRLVDYIVEKDGKIQYIDGVEPQKQVIDEKTARIIKAMLVSVVKNGHAKKAQVPGYNIGGKTGTAEIANNIAGGYSDETNHSFIGFGPLANTRFVVFVKLSKPKIGKFAESTAVPAFAKMANFLLQYYQIPPEE